MSSTPGLRRFLIPALILIAIIAPLAFSVLLYWQPSWFAFGHTNHGHLIRPPVKIAGTAALPAGFFRDHWTLVYVGGTHCGADCKEALYATRQIRLGLVEYKPRVRRLYIVRICAAPNPISRSWRLRAPRASVSQGSLRKSPALPISMWWIPWDCL
jgi:hypothetical protein